MINAKAVGLLLGLSATKVYDLARSGALVSYRFGGAVRFDPQDVEAYKQSCRVVVLQPVRCRDPLPTVRLVPSEPLGDDADLAAYFRAAGVKPRSAPSSVAKKGAPRKARPYPRTRP